MSRSRAPLRQKVRQLKRLELPNRVAPYHRHLILIVVTALVLCARGSAVAIDHERPVAQRGVPVTNLTFRQLDRSQGLAHPHVLSILQDRRGFMWFGTPAGLN